MVFTVIGLGVALIGAFAGLLFLLAKSAAQKKRFSAIVSVDSEVARIRLAASHEVDQTRAAAAEEATRLRAEGLRLRGEAEGLVASAQAEVARSRAAATLEAEAVRRSLRAEREAHAALTNNTVQLHTQVARLTDELRTVEGSLEDISFGLYKPQYTFDTPEQFKAEMDRVHDRQKEMVRAGKAASFAVAWTVGNSKRDGERMQKQYSKLLLRAFNGESDAAIAKVSWNNASRMEERIKKAFDAINQLGEVMTVTLSPGYRDLKVAELRLEYELAEKKREINDEQRRIREQMKDEEKAVREAEKAQADAEADETRFQKALDKATLELARSRGEEHRRLSEKILELQSHLAEAHAKSVRAKSLAEMTKVGHVYIISNIGSFGEHVFKIGMTRRLEPMDRVRELGAASVPFPFDVHAMVYSEDAPALETAFHQRFKDRSVNLINMRKEFFHVDVSELEAFAKQRGLAMAFTKLAEAREYRESAAMRLARGSGPTPMPAAIADRAAMASTLAKFSSKSKRDDRPQEIPDTFADGKPW
jgi:uncharacterized protein DUF4041/Meiotically Up-regulated Gene 113 (MUG113) protein